MSDAPRKLVPFFSRPLVIGIAAIAWTVMVGSAVARYMVAEGYIDEHALAQRADNVREFRDRVIDSIRANREIMAEEGDFPDDGGGGAGGGPISKRLSLSLRQPRADNLLVKDDPAVKMDEQTLAKEAERAKSKLESVKSLKSMLPYLSEGGLLMLLGIGLGLASRLFVKVVIVFSLLLIGGMEYLAYQGVLEVNWGAAAALLQETLLNATPNGDLAQVIKQKVPSLGALGGGFYLGARG